MLIIYFGLQQSYPVFINIIMNLRKIITEEINGIVQASNPNILYHGTRTPLPYKQFDAQSDGSGIVSSGHKYGGFFFTSEFNNAEFYSEYFIATVEITDIVNNPLSNTHSPTVLKQAIQDKKIYQINDVLDGGAWSNIVVVPMSLINNIKIVKWDFISEEEFYFQHLDEMFAYDNEEESEDGKLLVTQQMIKSFLSMLHEDLNYLLTIPVFKKYYTSKSEY